MKRFAEKYLENWLLKQRRIPLVLRGARQVGKSTLVRQFALKHKLNLIEVNLERNIYLDDLFKSIDIHKIKIGEEYKKVTFDLISLPLYLVEELPELIDKMRVPV